MTFGCKDIKIGKSEFVALGSGNKKVNCLMLIGHNVRCINYIRTLPERTSICRRRLNLINNAGTTL